MRLADERRAIPSQHRRGRRNVTIAPSARVPDRTGRKLCHRRWITVPLSIFSIDLRPPNGYSNLWGLVGSAEEVHSIERGSVFFADFPGDAEKAGGYLSVQFFARYRSLPVKWDFSFAWCRQLKSVSGWF
jgi:hypothetical protein